jgi:hypothetical protein
MFRCIAETDPVVAEARLDAGGDHRFQQVAIGLETDPVLKIAPSALFLHRLQHTAFIVMDMHQAILGELLGNEGDAIHPALVLLRR